jgi:hypothetical protein
LPQVLDTVILLILIVNPSGCSQPRCLERLHLADCLGIILEVEMAQQWHRETADRREHVEVTDQDGYERRREVVEDVGAARYEALVKVTQLIWLLFGVLLAAIALRIFLRLIAANPEAPFASLVYAVTDLFLWPFFGLTIVPSANGMALEIPSFIAMFVYAVVAWVVVRLIWLFFYRAPTRSVSVYERDEYR